MAPGGSPAGARAHSPLLGAAAGVARAPSTGKRKHPPHQYILLLAGVAFVLGLLLLLLASSSLVQEPVGAEQLEAGLPSAPPQCSAALRRRIAWGVATSAYQIEGAAAEGGRGASIWDTFSHTPGRVANNETGDVALDHYHLWREDVALMKALGIKYYRLSLSWARILPGGGRGTAPNPAGLAFYKALLGELRAAGITPVVTLYHWDLPQALQDTYGGFLDTQLSEDFVFYADAVFEALGPLVPFWITFSEPMSICHLGYGIGVFAPGLEGGAQGQYRCGHTLLLAHAKAVQLYRQKYQASQGGRIGLAISAHWGQPFNTSVREDVEAAEAYMQFQLGWIADPLWLGDYPPLMRSTQPDLPKFTPEQRRLLAGSADFLALNLYTSHFVRAPPEDAPPTQVFEEMLTDAAGRPPGNATDLFWLYSYPDAMRNTLAWASSRYHRPEIWVSENGVAAPGEAGRPLAAALHDSFRIDYFRSYLGSLCSAINEDGVNLSAYFAWSLLDNFEWTEGYRPRFGLVAVDYANGLRRYPKASAHWLSQHFFRYAPDSIACLEIRSCHGSDVVRVGEGAGKHSAAGASGGGRSGKLLRDTAAMFHKGSHGGVLFNSRQQ